MTKKIEIERFSLTSSRPFDRVVAFLNSAIGHPDVAEFWKSTIGHTQSLNWKPQSRKPWGKQG